MSNDERIEQLRRAAPDLERLRAVFEEHRERTDGLPGDYADVRRLARNFVDAGEAVKAAFVLVAALETLRRFFVDEDDDSDFGWFRREAKYWQRWATGRALRSVLVDSDPSASWRADVLRAVRALFDGIAPPLDNWFSASELMPLSPDDRAVLQGQSPRGPHGDWTAPEEEMADAVLAQSTANPETIQRIVGDKTPTGSALETQKHLQQLYFFRRVAGRLQAHSQWESAAMTAVAGLLYSSRQLPPCVLDHSMDAVRTSHEQRRGLEAVLKCSVTREAAGLRRRVLEAAGSDTDVLEGLRKIVGRGGDDDTAREIRELTRRYDQRETDDEKQTLARQLIFDYGDDLSDERYLAICDELGWISHQVDRLLSADRIDEAFTAARTSVSEQLDGRLSHHQVAETVRAFLEHGHPARAADLVEPHAGENLELAGLSARALLESDRAEAAVACLSWFKMRPTLKIYRAIQGTVPEAQWPALKDQLHDHLDSANLHHTIVDIAVDDGDVDALNELLPTLDGISLEHARGRVGSLKTSLSDEAVDRLEGS